MQLSQKVKLGLKMSTWQPYLPSPRPSMYLLYLHLCWGKEKTCITLFQSSKHEHAAAQDSWRYSSWHFLRNGFLQQEEVRTWKICFSVETGLFCGLYRAKMERRFRLPTKYVSVYVDREGVRPLRAKITNIRFGLFFTYLHVSSSSRLIILMLQAANTDLITDLFNP